MSVATADLEDVFADYGIGRHNLIPILQDVQALLGYLSRPTLCRVADHLNLSVNDVFGVATFYAQFRFTPPGRHQIRVCQGTACHVRGSGQIMDEVVRRLGIFPGETTPDREYGLEQVACFGSCALAPVVVVDDKVHGRITPRKMAKLLPEQSQ